MQISRPIQPTESDSLETRTAQFIIISPWILSPLKFKDLFLGVRHGITGEFSSLYLHKILFKIVLSKCGFVCMCLEF